jgi:hypothetical protein
MTSGAIARLDATGESKDCGDDFAEDLGNVAVDNSIYFLLFNA